jgi:hypothetical protein
MANDQPVQALETRRLMAIDLSIGFELNGGMPFITSYLSEQQVTLTVRNRGTTPTPALVKSELFASRDRRFDAGDMQVAGGRTNAGLVGRRPFSEQTAFVPAGAGGEDPAKFGRYYLIAVVDRAGAAGRDANPADNVVVTRKPVLTVVPYLQSTIEDGNEFVAVFGTERSDKVGMIFSGDQLVVGVNGALTALPSRFVEAAEGKSVFVQLFGGNDRLACNPDVTTGITATGGSGNDRLSGGAGTDFLQGEAGSDFLLGGAGTDILVGGNGNDRLNGGPGADTLEGNDGDDRFTNSIDGARDTLNGGIGADRYDGKDANDILDSVESLRAN